MKVVHESGGFSKKECLNMPSPAITATQCRLSVIAGSEPRKLKRLKLLTQKEKQNLRTIKCRKPQYKVPSMQEIAQIPWNGFTIASTFSGCGGSCVGYRMAGFRVVWANEFVPAAQDTYKANKDPHCHLDCRDIKLVTAKHILKVTGLKKGELDLFDGSPPCQAFSTAGKRDKGWGNEKHYEGGHAQCNETLFDEYVRLLRGLQPKVFVAENVSGLVKGTAKGYFLDILAALKASGYRVKARVLDAQWLGVPQSRQRVIFIGVRNDLQLDPVHPEPLPYRYSIRDAIPWLTHCAYERGNVSPESNWKPHNKKFDVQHEPCGTIPATCNAICKVSSIHAQIIHTSRFSKRRVDSIDKPAQTVMAGGIGGSSRNQSLVQILGRVGSGFKQQEVAIDKPSTTILASHGTLGMAGPTHPTECRKFTIAEVKRICAFPDDFILTGSYAQQWERLGNSVPPVMMCAIASKIRDEILRKHKEQTLIPEDDD